jgi:ribosomal protein S18 acetylase RimI-like enzyme
MQGHTVAVVQVAATQWHALDDDEVVGRGYAARRPDGRLFLSIDTWHDAVFDRLAVAMLADLPRPLYTVVDEADAELTANWRQAGLTVRRREWEFLMSTDPQVTGETSAPPGVTILGMGKADEARLHALDAALRQEIDWHTMPAEVLPGPLDPARHAVAVQDQEYVGLVRVTQVARMPRIGVIAVLADRRRQGVGRALLDHVLGGLHRVGIGRATAEVQEANMAATALFEGVGARRASSNLELVIG